MTNFNAYLLLKSLEEGKWSCQRSGGYHNAGRHLVPRRMATIYDYDLGAVDASAAAGDIR